MVDLDQLAAKAQIFRELHAGPEMLVMANIWDAASAKGVEAAGFPAIATTSAGVAKALGYADHEHAPVDEMIASAARVVSAVSLPVTIDFEAGYGLTPAEIARRLIEIGAVGLNIEDTDYLGGTGLVPADAQAERLAAIKTEAHILGVDLFLNARIDVYIHGEGNLETQVADGTRRALLYRQAGADCVYPIALSDPDALRAMVAAAGIVNVMLRRGGPLSLDTAATTGARRATYAGSLFSETMAALDAITAEIRVAVVDEALKHGRDKGAGL